MSTQSAGGGSASVGAGPGNDSMGGSQKASGGSGGDQLTRSLEDTGSAAPSGPVAKTEEDEAEPEGAGTAVTAATRGPQDTHSHQAGPTKTGLGVPETGANQQPGDMAPPSE